LAIELNTEVVSADSRQFYKELKIGTAKPTSVEMKGVKHHFIDSHHITNHLSSAIFAVEAERTLNEIFATKDVAVLVGGSGMYIDALCEGIDDIPVDPEIKSQLQKEWKTTGLVSLLEELKNKDAKYYENVDRNNPMRILRALEVIRLTGQPFSQLRTSQKKEKYYDIKRFVINHDRSTLYERIDKRVIKMMDDGLLDEVKNVRQFSNLQALQTVGYKELFAYLNQQISLEDAVQHIQKNTRNYAKRQLTWFRRHEDAEWISYDTDNKMIERILTFL
jgi:tRNA dimethylallyltransferase